MDLGELFTSGPAVTFYVALVLFGWNWLKRRQGWDTERWEGIIATAFALAEKSGFKTSSDKANYAIKVFTEQYQKTWNKEPDKTDLQDAALDFGRMAMEYKFASGGK